jgi:hypothetical protein
MLKSSVGWKSDVASGHADPDEQAAFVFDKMRKELPSSYVHHIGLMLLQLTFAVEFSRTSSPSAS